LLDVLCRGQGAPAPCDDCRGTAGGSLPVRFRGHEGGRAVTGIAEVTAAILAGGSATRLRPLTEHVPKALVDVAGRPCIDHQLRLLAEHGIRRVVLLVGYLGEQVEAHVGDGHRFGVEVRYAYDGKDLRGTGGAIRQALPQLGSPFWVMY